MVYRRIRRLWVRILHPFRRRRALKRIAALGEPRRILVLCTGNICRSPYAGVSLARILQGRGDVEVLSAGLMGRENPSPPDAQSVARERGFDLGPHRSRLLTRKMADWAELVVVMDPMQGRRMRIDFGVDPRRIVILSDLDPETPTLRGIFDPLGHPREVFQEVYEQEDRCLGELARAIQAED